MIYDSFPATERFYTILPPLERGSLHVGILLY